MYQSKQLMKGNEAVALGAIQADCKAYFGYPITPQSEIMTVMAQQLPENDGVFLQAESEVAAINMVYGAAGTGVRALTSSSGPGMSLMMEGLSYIAGADLPCVIVNVQRAGAGLGGVLPSQGDYFQATKGGGHGGYKVIVLAPASVQEMYDLTIKAFELSDKYRVPAIVLSDGIIGQILEPVEVLNKKHFSTEKKEWATTGTKMKRQKNLISSINRGPGILEKMTQDRVQRYKKIEQNEQKAEVVSTEDAEIILVAYGSSARVCKTVISDLANESIKVGLIRPILLWPFPQREFEKYPAEQKFLVVEMNEGQMIEDVFLAVEKKKNVFFLGKSGGGTPSVKQISNEIKKLLEK